MSRNTRHSAYKLFLIEHVEKLLFVVALSTAAFLAWSGLSQSGTAGLSAPKTPDMLLERAEKAEQHVEGFTWSDFEDQPERSADTDLESRFEAVSKENAASWRSSSVLNPPYHPPRQKRQDPQLFSVLDLQVRAGFTTAEKRSRNQRNDDEILDGPVTIDPKHERPIPGSNVNRSPQRRLATGGSGKLEGVFFTSVTGLIPYRQQVEEYDRCFAETAGYDRNRDSPKYLDFRLYRAEILPGENTNYELVASRRTAAKTLKRWNQRQLGAQNGGALIDDDATSVLTMPLLAFSLSHDRLDELMRHPTIPKFVPQARRSVRLDAEDEQPADDDGSSREREQIIPIEELPEFKMLRYIDLNVTPGKTYRYKVVLRLEDPNDPDLRRTAAPNANTLELPVQERVIHKNETHLAKFKQSDRTRLNYYLRASPESAPSQTITVPDGRRIVIGNVSAPPVKKGRLPRSGREPRAEMMALEFDAENATDIPATFRAYRGTIGNFVAKDVEVPYWTEGVLRKWIPKGEKKPQPYQFQTNIAVMDIDGGRVLSRGKLREVGEVLVWKDGKMSVISETDSRKEFDRFTFPKERQDARGD